VHRRRAHASRTFLWLALAGAVVAGGAASGLTLARSTPTQPSTQVAVPLKVITTTPVANETNVAPDSPIVIQLSAPLTPDSPMPTLAPGVPGRWALMSATQLEFVPAAPLTPGAQEVVTIPGGPGGLASTHGRHLAQSQTIAFTVAPGSILRLQQLLAELGYLPLTFTPTTQPTSPASEAQVQEGSFSWRWPEPPSLTALWAPGTDNVITRGAVMAFEDQHGLATDGIAGPQVWADLLQAAATGQSDPKPYDYVVVSESLPESLTVYRDGAPVYTTLANTGVPAAPTALGTFPVYERFTSTTMSGTNPDGSHYSDPGVPWVSYFNGGDALHGFVRPGYGYPQSDGCVEMPIANAAIVWPMTPIGTLVTVQ